MSSKDPFRFILLTLVSIFFISNIINPLYGKEENPLPMLCVGGGYLDGGSQHSGGVFQVEYKWGKYFWHRWRPQINLMVPELCSLFLGVGIGWEWNLTERITLTPSFTPGLYYRGNGRNLGFPLEFRSAIELTYRLNNNSWIGIQASHISNAHLSKKNPGINAFVLFFAVPIIK